MKTILLYLFHMGKGQDVSTIALVHDYFVHPGGAERVAAAMHDSFPDAPVYTAFARPQGMPPRLRTADIRTSPAQNFPVLLQRLLGRFGLKHFDLSQYDLIFSSAGFTRGIHRHREAIHVSYSYIPEWRSHSNLKPEGIEPLAGPKSSVVLRPRSAYEPNYYIAGSQLAAQRIRHLHGRDALVIPPPIDVNRFQMSHEIGDYYLVVSRLLARRRIDLAIEACMRANRRLIVIGDGPARRRLESLAGKRVEFLGQQPEPLIYEFVAGCRALLVPSEEDFALTTLEANAAGRPVLAYRGGSAVETLEEGTSGLFFDHPHSASLAEAIEKFEGLQWDQAKLRGHAERFDRSAFSFRILQFLCSIAPDSCAEQLRNSARLLAQKLAHRMQPPLGVVG